MSHRIRLSRAALMALAGVASSPLAYAAGYEPTSEEQYLLELINRARLDPRTEVYRHAGYAWGSPAGAAAPDLTEGLASFAIDPMPKQPLAFNLSLMRSVRDYSATLLNANSPPVTNYGGTSPTSRAMSAGYPFIYGGSAAESLTLSTSPAPAALTPSFLARQYGNLFVDAGVAGRVDRRLILDPTYQEIGVAVATKSNYTGTGAPAAAVLTAFDAATRTSMDGWRLPIMTGVVYTDGVTDNGSYDVGEGMGGVTVVATRSSDGATVATTSTFASGGYSLQLPDSGTYTMRFSGGALAAPITYRDVVVGNANMKRDAGPRLGVWEGTSSAKWSTAANWASAVPDGAGADVVVTGDAGIDVDQPRTVGSMRFLPGPYTTSQVHVTASAGGKLTLDTSGGVGLIDTGRGSVTITAPIQLNVPTEVVVGMQGTNVLGLSTLSGAISGSGGITKLGRGILQIPGNNTFQGGVNIVEGWVETFQGGTFGTGPVTIGWGPNTAYMSVLGGTHANEIRVAPGTGVRNLYMRSNNGVGTLSGAMTLSHDLIVTVASGSRLNLTGSIGETGGSYGLTVQATGATVGLAGANTYTGRTTMTSGVLTLSGSIAASAGLTVTGGTVQFTTDQDLKGLDVQRALSGTQSLDLNGRALRLFAADLVNAERDFAAQLALTGVDGIYDSTVAPGVTLGYAIQPDGFLLAKKVKPGDANVSGAVDFDDLLVLAKHYGAAGQYWGEGDFTRDGVVNFDDLLVLAKNYGQVLPAAPAFVAAEFQADWNLASTAAASVPEPATTLIGGLVLMGGSGRYRRRRQPRPGAA